MNSRILRLIIITVLIFSTTSIYAGSASSYTSQKVADISVKYITVDMNNTNTKPVVLNAKNQMTSSDSLANMAKSAGAFAAVNGTYFEAYNGTPVPWGTIIKDGKVLHISNSGAVFGITSTGRMLVDRLSFDFEGYINGEYRAIPWRINHPSTEAEAITIFTPEYGTTVGVAPGAKAVIVKNGKVTQVATSDFGVPSDGFAIVYNPSVAHLVDERYQIGDEVSYQVKIKTTFTDPSDWNDVTTGLGAGPSLIINGVVTAQGEPEGFTEAKINTNSSARSFIGAKADGKIIIGNMPSATLKQAAKACQSLGLINAMCLDGGGSVALYYPASSVSVAGRNINNGLAFVDSAGIYQTAKPTSSNVLVNRKNVGFTAYNIAGSNYFKLRDLAMALNSSGKQFDVSWDSGKNAILLLPKQSYTVAGGELTNPADGKDRNAYPSTAKVYMAGSAIPLKAYNIGGNNYFKLRDVGACIDFSVNWDAAANTIRIDTETGYTAENSIR